MKVFIYVQKLKHEDKGIFRGFLTELKNNNIDIHVKIDEVENDTAFNFEEIKVVEWRGYEDIKEKRPNFIITLGGDGTMLHAVTLIRDSRIPVLGINLGRLGFLASVEKKFITNAVYQLMNGMYRIEERTLLHLDCNKPIFGNTPIALNDFTILKRDNSSMITIHTYVNGDFLNSYWADGIIVATPTGSTGYSMSCGGPIVFPGSGNLVITPVAPHSLNVRPLVISDTREISFQVEGRGENFLCTLDSRYETITHDDRIKLSRCDFHINLVMLESMDFMNTIRTKLMWGLDKRN